MSLKEAFQVRCERDGLYNRLVQKQEIKIYNKTLESPESSPVKLAYHDDVAEMGTLLPPDHPDIDISYLDQIRDRVLRGELLDRFVEAIDMLPNPIFIHHYNANAGYLRLRLEWDHPPQSIPSWNELGVRISSKDDTLCLYSGSFFIPKESYSQRYNCRYTLYHEEDLEPKHWQNPHIVEACIVDALYKAGIRPFTEEETPSFPHSPQTD